MRLATGGNPRVAKRGDIDCTLVFIDEHKELSGARLRRISKFAVHFERVGCIGLWKWITDPHVHAHAPDALVINTTDLNLGLISRAVIHTCGVDIRSNGPPRAWNQALDVGSIMRIKRLIDKPD